MMNSGIPKLPVASFTRPMTGGTLSPAMLATALTSAIPAAAAMPVVNAVALSHSASELGWRP